MKRKCVILVFGIIIGILIICFAPWISIFIGTMLLEESAKPEIVRGEFSFTLVYEINGERKVIEDTLICEFDGVGVDEGRGKYLKWEGELASGNTNIILWEGRDKKGRKQEIYYNCAPPGYYMGDPYYEDGNNSNASDVVLRKKSSDGVDVEFKFISEKKLLQKYNIEIISWDCEEPIKNVFG